MRWRPVCREAVGSTGRRLARLAPQRQRAWAHAGAVHGQRIAWGSARSRPGGHLAREHRLTLDGGLDSGSVRFRAALHPLAGPMGFGQFVQVSAAQGEALLATPGVALWRETGGARGTDQLLGPPLRPSVGPQPCRERAPLRRARRGAHGTVTGYEGGGGVSRHLRPRLLVDEADEQVLRALGNETIRFRPTWTSWR